MKITYSQIYKYCIYLIFLLNLLEPQVYSLMISLILMLGMIILYLTQRDRQKINSVWIKLYLISILCLSLIQMARFLMNPYISVSSRSIFLPYGERILVFLVFPLFEVVKQYKEKIIGSIVKLGYCVLACKTLVWFLYNFLNINLFIFYLGGREGWSRTFLGLSLFRVNGTFIDGLLLVYSAYLLIFSKSISTKLYSLFGLLFLYFYAVVVYQSRTQLIFYSFTLLIMIFYMGITSKQKYIIFLTLVALLIFSLFIVKNQLINFINSFSTATISENSASTMTRIQEYTLFPQLWSQRSLWWGFGIVPTAFSVNSIVVIIGDVGIIMELFQFGIVGFCIGMIPFLLGIKQVITNKAKEKSMWNILIVGLTAYYWVSFLNFNPYHFRLLLLIPIYLSLLMMNKERT